MDHLRAYLEALRRETDAEVRDDPASRYLYSTDASIYQIMPQAVVLPRIEDHLAAIVALAAEFGVPLVPRGAGSGLAGQAIGPGVVVDFSRHLNAILEVNPEARTATVQPGVVLGDLNRHLAAYGLQFGPDPSSADRATVGGVIGTNATGAHSIRYGMAADHLLAAEVLLADGTSDTWAPLPLPTAQKLATGAGAYSRTPAALYRFALDLRTRHADLIRERWPRLWRRASGYNLPYLLPWAPDRPPQWDDANGMPGGDATYPPLSPDTLSLAPLLAGSEGTLALARRLTLHLVPRPAARALAVLAFPSVAHACEAVPDLLERRPSAIELLPAELLRLALTVPAYARDTHAALGPLLQDGLPQALLLVEFDGQTPEEAQRHARKALPHAFLAADPDHQAQIWAVRKVGLGLLMSRPGRRKPVAFIEDLAVPVERLAHFAREMERLLAAYGTEAAFYAHASAGVLHIRPLLDLHTEQGVRDLRAIAQEAVDLTLSVGGVVSGEHGDGLARSEWLERQFGSEIVALFRRLKKTADPQGLLNPGKIVDAPPMDANLRYGPEYRTPHLWTPTLDFSAQDGLAGAVEQCNGAGVCRKSTGVMCPSFQATREEQYTTRGRANLLRALLTGAIPQAEEAAKDALDLCLACKGCKAECPSAVDMAKLKYEFLHHYYRTHRRPVRDYLFAFVDRLAPWGAALAPVANLLTPILHRALGGLIGLETKRRSLPKLAWRWPRSPLPSPSRRGKEGRGARSAAQGGEERAPTVLYLPDAFTRYFEPEVERAALALLRAAGERPLVLPVVGAGRPLISKGFLDAARQRARQVLAAIQRLDPDGRLPVVGAEPSEIYTLGDEYPDLLPSEATRALARRAWLVDEYLLRRPEALERLRALRPAADEATVRLHGHCYQKARPPAEDGQPVGVSATVAFLEALGVRVEVIEAGCCGMAGAFGYEAEHVDLSFQIGELALFPAVRQTPLDVPVLAVGTSCRHQIYDGTQREAIHPLVYAARLLEPSLTRAPSGHSIMEG
ncbi:MAG TPA: FAD-binding oxidoreductase [Anaerolineales bacterium]|nr:FAD-binding oxidoreductase [Anaerolineales bacterium]